MNLQKSAWATAVVFAGMGTALSVWAARLPTTRDLLDFSPAQMGLLLLVASLGSGIALPLTGPLILRFGLRQTLSVASVILAFGIAGASVAAALGSPAFVAAALFIGFAGSSAVDVGMNIQGGRLEQDMGRTIMPLMHAGFSGGAILGALIGSMTAHFRIGLIPTIAVTSVLVLVAFLGALRFFADMPLHADAHTSARRAARAWVEPRTLMLGLVVMGAGLTEGAATDWMALAVVDGFHQTESLGALAYGLFMTCLMITRIFGSRLLDTYGRLATLRALTALAGTGLLIFVFAPKLELAMVGVVLWGIGVALGFPTGMSAASDEPIHGAARVSVVSTVGYLAFLAGPPILGLLAENFGYRSALGFIMIPLVIGFLALPATRPPAPQAVRA